MRLRAEGRGQRAEGQRARWPFPFALCPLPFALCLALGCGDPPGTARIDFRRRPEAGKAVATFQNGSISDQELEQRFAEMSPFARARYQTVEQKREYLDGLLRFELLAQEAARRGLTQDKEVVENFKKELVRKLLRQELEEKPLKVDPKDVAAYYEKHKTDYVKPAMTRLVHVFVAKANKEKGERLLKEAQAMAPMDYAAFARLAKENSEEPRTQPIEGDMRFLSDDELAAQYGPELVAAAKELTQVGQVLPRLVETEKGWHVIKLQGRQVALNLSLEQVKTSIENILANEAKQARYRELLESLKKSANLYVDQGALAGVAVDPKAPTRDARGVVPGFIPAPEGTTR
jgi:peptidyl-prolyl cis-trans isomerase C